MKDVAVVAYCRTGIAKAGRGALNQTHGIPMAAHVLRNVVQRAGIDAAEVHRAVIGVCTAGGMATAAYLER
jgi:acetyl-CoA C-acetyltransferase